MLKFGIIAEGPTDQTVIENILVGYFDGIADEPSIRYIQPARPLTPAGWTRVFQSLSRKDHVDALQFNDYLVIHIDTDVQEEPGFDVPRREAGSELSVEERVDRVIARLKQEIDPAFYEGNADRILFAVAVDSIECWLLPLLYDDNKAGKVTGCLEAANRELRRRNLPALSAADGTKFTRAYDKASSALCKRKILTIKRDKNPSFQLFVKNLEDLMTKLSADDNKAPPGE